MGLGSILGSVASAGANYLGNKIGADYTWKRDKRMFDWQKDWELYKMENAHQIEVEDLKKAGMNPALTSMTSGAVGSGAPSGGNAPGLNLGNMGQEAINNMNTTTQLEQRDRELQIQENKTTQEIAESVERTKWIPKKEQSEIQKNNSESIKNSAETNNINTNTELQNAEITKTAEETIALEIDNQINEIKKEVNTGKMGKALAYVDRVIETIENGGKAVAPFVGIASMLKTAKQMGNIASTVKNFENSNIGKILKSYKRRR